VEKKSLSKAAEEFSYTPSALSHAADSVERELGVKLLKRTYAGVSLTEEGEKLLHALRSFVASEEKLYREAKALGGKGEELKIAAYSSISLQVLPEIVKAFKLSNPSVRVSISVGNHLKNALLNGEADVVFSDSPAEGEAVWRELKKDPFVAVVPNALFAKRKKNARRKADKLSTAGMVVAIVIIASVAMLISCQFRFGALVIATDSMTGEINKGDMIIYERYDDQVIREGQVVVFMSDNNNRIVHRVVRIENIDGETRYYTKGDFNKEEDYGFRTDADIVGLTDIKVAYVGYPTLWLHELISN
jgi:signal peptidase I